jgi:hypothetical protein
MTTKPHAIGLEPAWGLIILKEKLIKSGIEGDAPESTVAQPNQALSGRRWFSKIWERVGLAQSTVYEALDARARNALCSSCHCTIHGRGAVGQMEKGSKCGCLRESGAQQCQSMRRGSARSQTCQRARNVILGVEVNLQDFLSEGKVSTAHRKINGQEVKPRLF